MTRSVYLIVLGRLRGGIASKLQVLNGRYGQGIMPKIKGLGNIFF